MSMGVVCRVLCLDTAQVLRNIYVDLKTKRYPTNDQLDVTALAVFCRALLSGFRLCEWFSMPCTVHKLLMHSSSVVKL